MPADIGFEQAVIEGINAQVDTLAAAIAGGMGMPPGGKRYTQREQDEEWNFSPIADPRTRLETMAQLLMLGKSTEEITDQIYPKRRKLIETGRPRHEDRQAFARQMKARMAKLATEMLEAGPPAQGVPPSPTPTAAPPPASPSSFLDQPLNPEVLP